MMWSLKVLWAVLIVSLTSVAISCGGGGGDIATPSTYSISGTVTYNGSGLPIVIVTANGGSTTTDNSGNYILENLQNGTYIVSVSKAGYILSTSQSVTISNANVTNINFYVISATPLAPSDLTATTASSNQIMLSWTDNATNETGYKIERKVGAAGTYTQVVTANANANSYTDAGLMASTVYYYRVRATNNVGDSTFSNETNSTTDTIHLPKTGQATSYAAGDDGSLQRGSEWPSPRFTNLDGTTPVSDDAVIDNLTGLVWTKDANTPGPSVCPPGKTMRWHDALLYISCLNTNSYLGFTDWHLPNRNELISLLNYGQQGKWADWLSLQGFNNVQYHYYTSTPYAPDIDIDFDLRWYVWGDVETISISSSSLLPVWPVRGLSSVIPRTGYVRTKSTGDDGDLQYGVAWPVPRFTNIDSSTPVAGSVALDKLTGLMWTRDGNAPGPNVCNPSMSKSWQEALDHIDCLNANNYLGYSDWVLPNLNELESLLNLGEANQATWLIGQGFLNVQAYPYWASTTNPLAVNPFAWVISMKDGHLGPSDKPNKLYVWPVRGNQ